MRARKILPVSIFLTDSSGCGGTVSSGVSSERKTKFVTDINFTLIIKVDASTFLHCIIFYKMKHCLVDKHDKNDLIINSLLSL